MTPHGIFLVYKAQDISFWNKTICVAMIQFRIFQYAEMFVVSTKLADLLYNGINMKCLIYDNGLSGHHLEYLYNIHQAVATDSRNEYIFAIPESFNEKKSMFPFGEYDNIKFHFFPDKEFSPFANALNVASIAKKTKVDKVFLISLMSAMPFIAFLIPKGVKISGIIYMIYLYSWKEYGFFKKLSHILKYLIFSKISAFENIYILNDLQSAKILNRIYNCKKFRYLPDPVLPSITRKRTYSRGDYGLPENSKIFLHFGGISRRKGSLEILKAIESLPPSDLTDKTFVFAGIVGKDVRVEFYKRTSTILKAGVDIRIIDKFCDYDTLCGLCSTCDYILIPYFCVNQSSGCLSYGAYYKKPVIATNSGLLKRLLRRYRLGIRLKNPHWRDIAEILRSPSKINIDPKRSEAYINDNSVDKFTAKIIRGLTKCDKEQV